jgi:DNA replication protein DnaC
MGEHPQEARVNLLLTELRLPSIRRIHRRVAREVTAAGGDFLAYLHALLEEETRDRSSRRNGRRVKEARFRQVKLLSELDPKALPKGISMAQIWELASGEYLQSAWNIVAIGSSGTGKTHICTGLGVEACRQGKRVRAYTAAELVSELAEAQEAHQLHRYLRRFSSLDLVVVDELGYLPIDERGADLLFQAFSERNERGSLILNSNLPFSEWGQIFRNERLAVALLDRVTHRAHILEMDGESYRLRSARGGRNQPRKPGRPIDQQTKEKRKEEEEEHQGKEKNRGADAPDGRDLEHD